MHIRSTAHPLELVDAKQEPRSKLDMLETLLVARLEERRNSGRWWHVVHGRLLVVV